MNIPLLDGKPEPESMARVDACFRGRPLVCLTREWEERIRTQYPEAAIYRRTMMKPACRFTIPEKTEIPEGCRLRRPDAAELYVAWHDSPLGCAKRRFPASGREIRV